jgi:hypothetical protein
MAIDGDLESEALGEHADLAADEADGIDIEIGIARDPRHATSETESQGRDRRRRGQQHAEDEDWQQGLAHQRRAYGTHGLNSTLTGFGVPPEDCRAYNYAIGASGAKLQAKMCRARHQRRTTCKREANRASA